MVKGSKKLEGFAQIFVHIAFCVKQNGRMKVDIVAGVHMIGINTEKYSSVTSLFSMDIFIFIFKLNYN